jgi:hypothetical protein
MSLDRPFLDAVCKMGQGHDCCRYLVGAPNGIQCAKLDAGLALTIDQRATAGLMTARADNCAGLPMDP